jgi:hypothetical protein
VARSRTAYQYVSGDDRLSGPRRQNYPRPDHADLGRGRRAPISGSNASLASGPGGIDIRCRSSRATRAPRCQGSSFVETGARAEAVHFRSTVVCEERKAEMTTSALASPSFNSGATARISSTAEVPARSMRACIVRIQSSEAEPGSSPAKAWSLQSVATCASPRSVRSSSLS